MRLDPGRKFPRQPANIALDCLSLRVLSWTESAAEGGIKENDLSSFRVELESLEKRKRRGRSQEKLNGI